MDNLSIEKCIEDIFKADGILSKHFPSYEPRAPQIEMAESVVRSLVDRRHGLIEAGTGTGKSFGYAIAAALHALINEQTVVLSTFTVTLQNQLMTKDLPLVQRVMEDLGLRLNFELAKGRSHYICKRRLMEAYADAVMKESPKKKTLEFIVDQLDALNTGDRAELSVNVPFDVWEEIQGKSDDCLSDESPYHDSCFIQSARAKLKTAQIIVTNHAMFFTDFNLKQNGMYGVFPDYDAVVFDEGHRIEDVFSKYFQKTASVRALESLFDRMLKRRSQWVKEAMSTEMEQEVTKLKVKALRVAQSIFSQVTTTMIEQEVIHGLLNGPLLERSPFNEPLNEFTKYLSVILQSKKWEKSVEKGIENMLESIERLRRDFEHLLLNEDTERWANWIQISQPKDIDPDAGFEDVEARRTVLTGAPIEASTVLQNTLFRDKTVVLTSATLTTSGTFDFVAGRLGMDSYIGYQVGSPFDYRG